MESYWPVSFQQQPESALIQAVHQPLLSEWKSAALMHMDMDMSQFQSAVFLEGIILEVLHFSSC